MDWVTNLRSRNPTAIFPQTSLTRISKEKVYTLLRGISHLYSPTESFNLLGGRLFEEQHRPTAEAVRIYIQRSKHLVLAAVSVVFSRNTHSLILGDCWQRNSWHHLRLHYLSNYGGFICSSASWFRFLCDPSTQPESPLSVCARASSSTGPAWYFPSVNRQIGYVNYVSTRIYSSANCTLDVAAVFVFNYYLPTTGRDPASIPVRIIVHLHSNRRGSTGRQVAAGWVVMY